MKRTVGENGYGDQVRKHEPRKTLFLGGSHREVFVADGREMSERATEQVEMAQSLAKT